MIQQINYINKALYMEIIKPQITISITKGELNTLIAEALTNPDVAATIKRAIAPLLANSFPQFPDFTNITLGETAEDGTTAVILKQPKQVEPKVDSPIQSMEPLVVTEPDEVPTSANDYVEPTGA
jgi:hypothetical protein